jgi:effector-binding domain-containing protein
MFAMAADPQASGGSRRSRRLIPQQVSVGVGRNIFFGGRMPPTADNLVRVELAPARAIAAVMARLPMSEVPRRFAEYLDQVYAAARGGAIQLDGQNIFVYRGGAGSDGASDVEFGVGVTTPFASAGPVRYSTLPAGEVAATTHWGEYGGLGAAHDAVIAWCQAHGRELAGPRWEVYGHWSDDPARRRTDVYYLLRS